MEAAVILLVIFGSVFAVFYVYFTTRNKERLALIEKGADAKLFKSGPSSNNYSGIIIINVASLAIGIGVGVLLGNLLDIAGMDEEIAMTSMIFICGGIGLLAGYFASRKLVAKKEE